MKGQQIGYNNKSKYYSSNLYFIFVSLISLILLIFLHFSYLFWHDYKMSLFEGHPLIAWVSIIIHLLPILLSIPKSDELKGNLKFFYFENYILNNDDKKIPYNVFIHATMSNRLCKLVSNNKNMNVVFLVEKNINEKELLQLLNEKITEANEEQERKALEDQEEESAIVDALRYLSDNS